ncbi:ABC transporter ATP-binding protein [Nocardioidaceae bacterium]|nr:ABC transporter ATP-binding protein [Nocardioidaceae bacterium]
MSALPAGHAADHRADHGTDHRTDHGVPVGSAEGLALRTRGLGVRIDGKVLLDDIDLDVCRGEWLGVIGPNGAGKSTLLRAILGLGRPTGRVLGADGRPVGRTEVALMPQQPMLPAGMTVVEYALLGRTAHLGWLQRESRSDRDVVTGVLRRLDLARFADREVSSLSGGEAQRVVLARALTQEADVLLLDEPTSALDVGHQVEVLDLVDELRRADGLTVLAAMHDLGTAARYADRLALVHEGRVRHVAQPAEVLEATLLSEVYATPLAVHVVGGDLVVLPASPRSPRPHRSPDRQESP